MSSLFKFLVNSQKPIIFSNGRHITTPRGVYEMVPMEDGDPHTDHSFKVFDLSYDIKMRAIMDKSKRKLSSYMVIIEVNTYYDFLWTMRGVKILFKNEQCMIGDRKYFTERIILNYAIYHVFPQDFVEQMSMPHAYWDVQDVKDQTQFYMALFYENKCLYFVRKYAKKKRSEYLRRSYSHLVYTMCLQ